MLAGLLGLFLVVPLVSLIGRGGDALMTPSAGTREAIRTALPLTLATSAIALIPIIGLGTPLAYLLARRRFRGRVLIDTLVDLPLVLPPAVAGIALLTAFGRRGVLGDELDWLGIRLPFTAAAVVLAQVFTAAPFYVRSARAGFARIQPDLEASAADLGATPWQVFRTVTLPLALSAMGAGLVLAWARAIGEFGATIIFAGNFPGRTQTMSVAIYSRIESGDLPSALGLSVVLLAAAMMVVLGVRVVGRTEAT